MAWLRKIGLWAAMFVAALGILIAYPWCHLIWMMVGADRSLPRKPGERGHLQRAYSATARGEAVLL